MKVKFFALTVVSLACLAQATALSDLVKGMSPGTWAQLTTINCTGALGNAAGGATGNVIPYTDDIQWDPTSHQLYFIGSDHQHGTGYARFVTYSETTNTWTELPRPTFFQPLTEYAMHGYDHSALNPKTGELFHRPFGAKRSVVRYGIPTASWRSGFSIPTTLVANDNEMACCIGMDWFPEYNGLIFFDGGGSGWIYSLKFSTSSVKWNMLKAGVTMGGYHNISEYNPVHKVMVGGGGNGSNALYKVDSTGAVTSLKTPPLSLGIETSVFTVDPSGGDYLAFNHAREFWAYNVNTDTWTQQSGTSVPIYTSNSDGPIQGVVATPVSNYGVTLFVSCSGANNCWVSVYKRTAMAGISGSPSVQSGAASLSLSPNPVTRFASVKVSGIRPVECRLLDVRGRLFQTLKITQEGNGTENQFTLDAANLPAGFYLMQVTDGVRTLSHKVFVQK